MKAIKTLSVILSAVLLTASLASCSSIETDNTGAVVSLDVNPSIEFTINKKEEVKTVTALNDDGEAILAEVEVKGQKIDEAINTVVDELVEAGYITVDANSVLVSVEAKKIKDTDALEAALAEKIAAKLAEYDIEGAITTQAISVKDEIKALAEKYGFSAGRAKLIYVLTEKVGTHTFEELSTLTVNELMILLEESGIEIEDGKKHGKINMEGYITKDEALEIALADAKLTKDDVTDVDVDFGFEKFTKDEIKTAVKEQVAKVEKFVEDKINEKLEKTDKADDDEKTEEKVEETEAATETPADDVKKPVDNKNDKNDKKEDKKRDRVMAYEVEFETTENEYEYVINAVDGAIIDSEVEANDEDDDDDKKPAIPEKFLGKEAVLAIAKELGLDVTAIEVELEGKHGKWFYEIEYEKDGEEVVIIIDAISGEKLDLEALKNQNKPADAEKPTDAEKPVAPQKEQNRGEKAEKPEAPAQTEAAAN